MDGLDISYAEYFLKDNNWSFNLIHCNTVNYGDILLNQLKNATTISSNELFQLDIQLAEFFASETLKFIDQFNIDKKEITCIASHGHTIFHQPDKGYTVQIGNGEKLAALTQLPVVNDFRSKDVAHGGQGAPLVPVGDKLLFNSLADAFLNLGGFANICILNPNIKAFDISPANLPLNRLCNKIGLEYDKNGELASKGNVLPDILEQLNAIPFYNTNGPKSLGTEWLDAAFMPIINSKNDIEDLLRTTIEHIAEQISTTINNNKIDKVLVTGGGTKNKFLIERITAKTKVGLIVPEIELIDFKEAIVFGFLGALYLSKQVNCLAAVTGASKNVIGGVLHIP